VLIKADHVHDELRAIANVNVLFEGTKSMVKPAFEALKDEVVKDNIDCILVESFELNQNDTVIGTF
jgi:hypothetical protein